MIWTRSHRCDPLGRRIGLMSTIGGVGGRRARGPASPVSPLSPLSPFAPAAPVSPLSPFAPCALGAGRSVGAVVLRCRPRAGVALVALVALGAGRSVGAVAAVGAGCAGVAGVALLALVALGAGRSVGAVAAVGAGCAGVAGVALIALVALRAGRSVPAPGGPWRSVGARRSVGAVSAVEPVDAVETRCAGVALRACGTRVALCARTTRRAVRTRRTGRSSSAPAGPVAPAGTTEAGNLLFAFRASSCPARGVRDALRPSTRSALPERLAKSTSGPATAGAPATRTPTIPATTIVSRCVRTRARIFVLPLLARPQQALGKSVDPCAQGRRSAVRLEAGRSGGMTARSVRR